MPQEAPRESGIMVGRRFGHGDGRNPIAKTSRSGQHFNRVMEAFVRKDLYRDSGKRITNLGEAIAYAEKHQARKSQRKPGTDKNDFIPRRLGVKVKELTEEEINKKRNNQEFKPQSGGGKVRIWPPQ